MTRHRSGRSILRRAIALTCALGLDLAFAVGMVEPTAAHATTAPGCVFTAPVSVTCTYGFTGTEEIFYTPPTVGAVDIEAVGAAGAAGESLPIWPSPGGLGGTARRHVPLSPGQTRLFVEVGGAPSGGGCYPGVLCVGGFNGGGSTGHVGGGGGGASDVRTQPAAAGNTLATRLVVGAGGGGGGWDGTSNPDFAAGPGGAAGVAGGDPTLGAARGGGAGTQSAGGAGGAGGALMPAGSPGGFGVGGGASLGGAGGGGWYGGGGGGSGAIVEGNDPGIYPSGGGGGGSSRGDTVGIAPAGTAPSVTISYSLPKTGQLRQSAVTAGSGKCATAPAGPGWIGVALVLEPCATTSTDPNWALQQFTMLAVPALGGPATTGKGTQNSGVVLRNLKWNGCIDTSYAVPTNGTSVVLGLCTYTTSQTWAAYLQPQNAWSYRQLSSSRFIDTADAATVDGARLVIGDIQVGSPTQQWSAVAM